MLSFPFALSDSSTPRASPRNLRFAIALLGQYLSHLSKHFTNNEHSTHRTHQSGAFRTCDPAGFGRRRAQFRSKPSSLFLLSEVCAPISVWKPAYIASVHAITRTSIPTRTYNTHTGLQQRWPLLPSILATLGRLSSIFRVCGESLLFCHTLKERDAIRAAKGVRRSQLAKWRMDFEYSVVRGANQPRPIIPRLVL